MLLKLPTSVGPAEIPLTMDGYDGDEIVISGIGGHYPKCDNPQELMENLLNGVDMTSEDHQKWPPGTMGVPPKLGCMNELTKCDAQFFGIIRKHCNSLDPVTRKVLERTLEAVVDAGINPQDLKGTNTGVFISVALLETEMILIQSSEQETYGIMGRNRALNANRISYWLDLKGPSFAVDCMFNGGLQGLQEAYQAIKLGKIDAAIVGSGSTIIHPQSSYQYNKLHILSPDGNTRCFDAEANGYARAESVSIMLLQRARDAKRSHGTILHVLNQSMNTTRDTILQPIQDNWRALHEKFYAECNVDPKEVAYLEAEGQANLHADAIELNASAETFCKGRSSDNPLLVGSVKSNLGHAEGAANLCAVAKLIIALESDTLPPNLHYKTPNPMVRDLVQGKMKVVTEPTPLKGDLVALNSFGLGSTYGHLLLRKNPRKKTPVQLKEGALPQLILVSARREEGIQQVLDSVEAAPFDPEYANLVNSAFQRGVPAHMYRGYTVVPKQEPQIRSSEHYSGEQRPVWFIFSGMGSQWPTMARDLLHIPAFKRSIDISAGVLQNHGLDLIHILTHDDATLLDNIMHNFVAIVAVQMALFDVLRDLGITPDGIIGHSVGETSASYADGCLTQEQTILSAYFRGRASLETEVVKGTMAAVGLGYQQMKDQVPEGVEIACHNGPDSCTLSGPSQQVEEFVKKLSSEGVFARTVNVANIPYHSKYIKGMGPRMEEYLKHVIPTGRERSPRWISTSYPESRWGEPSAKLCNAAYHINNLLSPVLFEEGSKHIPANAITIELAPHGLLQAILKRSLTTCVNIGLTNRNAKNQQHVFLNAVGRMYQNGLEPKVHRLYPEVQYPVSRGTSFLSQLVTWDHSDNWSDFSSIVADKNARCKTYDLQLDLEDSILRAHKQDGVTVLPLAVFLTSVLEVFEGPEGKKQEGYVVELSDVLIHSYPSLSNLRDFSLYVLIQPGSGCFEVLSTNQDKEELLVTGVIKEIEKTTDEKLAAQETLETIQEMQQDEFYSELLHVGHQYDNELQTISKVVVGIDAWKATVNCKSDTTKLLESLLQVRTLQVSEENSNVQKIRKIRSIIIDTNELNSDQVEAVLELDTNTIRSGNIEIRDIDFTGATRSPIKFSKEELNAPLMTLPPSSESLQVTHFQFVGSEVEGKQLAYIGTEGSQRKVMGLGVTDETSRAIKEDPILKWEIPTKWTTENTVPVPLNYSLAYYAVHVVGQLTTGQSIVVTDGTNKLGVACLRVALEVTTDVITLVNNAEDVSQLRKLLPKMRVENILVNGKKASDQLCLKLKMRCPKGVNTVINTGSPDIIQMIIQCISPFGIAVEMSDELFDSRGKLKNTYDFLISASLYSCSGNDVINSPDDLKQQVQKLLTEGISSGVVVPFKEAHSKDWRRVKTVKLETGNKKNCNSMFQCDPEKAYLILGGDPYSWLAITEWFIQRKAKNIILVHKETKLNNSVQKKLQYLQEKCKLIVKPANKLSPELIDHIFTVSKAKIALTMVMPLAPEEEPQEDVVKALCRQETFLVSVLRSGSEAVNYCKERTRSSPTLTVLWNEPINGKTRGFLQAFDRLLTLEKNQVIQVNEGEEESDAEGDQYETLLPKTLEEVLSYGQDLPMDLRLTEIQTMSVGANLSKEVEPIFLIPGTTHRRALIDRFRDSLYPVIVVDFPSLPMATVAEYAACLIPKLKSVTKGPYTLLGDNWGGAVALEAAHLLEKAGDQVQVFLLTATPLELNKWASPEDVDITLLTRLFNTDAKVVRAESCWSERLSTCLATVADDQYQAAELGLNSIRGKVASLLTLRAREPLNGSVTCISKLNIPRSAVRKMSRKDTALTIVTPDEDILNESVFDMIHRTVAIKTIIK